MSHIEAKPEDELYKKLVKENEKKLVAARNKIEKWRNRNGNGN